MRTRRRIWSIPIAALALALMLAGALAVSGIVQANTVLGVTLTGPDDEVVPLVMIDDGDSNAATATARYTFPHNAAPASYTGNFTLTVPTNRTISAQVDADDETDGTQILSILTPNQLTQNIEVTHDLETTGDGTSRTLNIDLALENAPPTSSPIDDQLGIAPAGTVDTIALAASVSEISTPFADINDEDDLTYTVLTHNSAVVKVSFPDGSNNYPQAEDTSVVQAWWDSLDCDARNDALGSLNRDNTKGNDEGICQTTTATDNGQQPTYSVLVAIDVEDTAKNENLKAVVTQAFHWDMLTGAEMAIAAKQGGLSNPDGYKKPFSGLTQAQRDKVEGLYDGDEVPNTGNVLARGSGDLTLNRVNTGMVDITVKASDATGRFLGGSVGEAFTISTALSITNTDDDIDDPATMAVIEGEPGIQIIRRLAGTAAVADSEVEIVTTDAIGDAKDGLTFNLTGTDAGSFYIDSSSGLITTATHLTAGTYEFAVTAASHSMDDEADVIVMVGHTNQAPVVVADSPTSFNVKEQGPDESPTASVVIHDFMANFTDPDRERNLTFGLAVAKDSDGDPDKGSVAFLNHLERDGSVLSTAAGTFAWVDPDDDDDADNSHDFVITATDGAGLSASQTITINVVDAEPPAPPAVASTDIEIPESVKHGDEEPAAILEVTNDDDEPHTEGYDIIAQSPLGLVVNPNDADGDPIFGEIWEIDKETGELRIAANAIKLDFENADYPKRYVIAVAAGPPEDVDHDAFTLIITDVNEEPKFADDIAIDIAAADAETPGVGTICARDRHSGQCCG